MWRLLIVSLALLAIAGCPAPEPREAGHDDVSPEHGADATSDDDFAFFTDPASYVELEVGHGVKVRQPKNPGVSTLARTSDFEKRVNEVVKSGKRFMLVVHESTGGFHYEERGGNGYVDVFVKRDSTLASALVPSDVQITKNNQGFATQLHAQLEKKVKQDDMGAYVLALVQNPRVVIDHLGHDAQNRVKVKDANGTTTRVAALSLKVRDYPFIFVGGPCSSASAECVVCVTAPGVYSEKPVGTSKEATIDSKIMSVKIY